MKPTRSLLFVPGHKPAWMEKAIKYGADVLILDLEDSVPDREKEGRPTFSQGRFKISFGPRPDLQRPGQWFSHRFDF